MKLLKIGGPGLKYYPNALYIWERDEFGEVRREKPTKKGVPGAPIRVRDHVPECPTKHSNLECKCPFRLEGLSEHTFVTFFDGPHAGKERHCIRGDQLIFDHVGRGDGQYSLSPADFIDKGIAVVIQDGLPTCCEACREIVRSARAAGIPERGEKGT